MPEEHAPLVPPRVVPSPKPTRFPFNLAKILTNNLELIPERAYYEPLAIVPGPPRMAFFTGPDLVKDLLHTRHTHFPKGGSRMKFWSRCLATR